VAELKRSLTRLNATAMVAGTIIGASIFVQPSEIARHLNTPEAIMVAWLACGVLTLFGAFVCAELASAFPQTGGMYVFLRETFSPLAGFLWGWAMFWSVHSGIIAVIAMVFGRYASVFLPAAWQTDVSVRLLAIFVIAALSALNYIGVRSGSRVQTALTIFKVAAIAVLVVAGFALAPARGPELTAYVIDPNQSAITPFVLAMVAGLFAYGGWHMVTYTAGETTLPAKTIPAALVVGVGIVTACYVLLNLVYLQLLPLEAVRASTRIAADAADVMFGRGGAMLLAVLVIVSTVGSLTGIILTGPRMYFSMAEDGLAPRALAYVHPAYRTPAVAIVAQGIWASLLAWTGVYRQLFTRVVYTEWLFFALMAAGLFLLRRRADYRPAFRTPLFPAIPIVFIAASLFIVVHQLIADPREALVGLALVGIGVPVYYLRHAHHRLS
jgi:APA family basic amino acid/polyamine antiporter